MNKAACDIFLRASAKKRLPSIPVFARTLLAPKWWNW